MLSVDASVQAKYPTGCFAWITVENISQSTDRAGLDARKKQELEILRREGVGYERDAYTKTAPVCHYVAYYKAFGKTYPVLLQRESILLKGKGIPSVGPAVEAMFLAEVQDMLLTAGHDLERIKGTLTTRVSDGTERYRGISGKEQQLKAGDIYVADEAGILSSILYGPDERTKVTAATTSVLYFVYGVRGITAVQLRTHLEKIGRYLKEVMPEAEVGPLGVSVGVAP